MSNTDQSLSLEDSPDHPLFDTKRPLCRDGVEYSFDQHTPLSHYPLEETIQSLSDITELVANEHADWSELPAAKPPYEQFDYQRLTWGIQIVFCTDPADEAHLAEYEVTSGNHGLGASAPRTERSFEMAVEPLIENATPHQYVNRTFLRIW